MEIIIIPLLLVLLVLLIHINNVNSQAFRNLRAKLDGLLRETNQLKEEIKKFQACRRAGGYKKRRPEGRTKKGNDSVGFPKYDLAFFQDSIPLQLTTLEHGKVLANNQVISATSNKNWWIWPAVIIMMIALTLLTYRLMGDIRKAKV
jgi:hypothetical protein